ncbi:MAG: type II secretion system F family protein [Pseudomonadota bacterium]
MLETFFNEPGLLIFAGALASLLLIIPATVLATRDRSRVSSRLDLSAISAAQPETSATQGASDWFAAIGQRLTSQSGEEVSRLRKQLMRAGFFKPSSPYVFLGIQLASLVLPQILLLISLPFLPFELEGILLLLTSAALAIIGYMIPTSTVNRLVERREQHYRDGFPDMMDLLVACVEAGLSMDAAIVRISDELRLRYEHLAAQLYMMSLEIRAGRNRSAAWDNFAERLGLEEARALAVMLKQSDDLGTSVGETLRVFAVDMRERRMLLAEEKALALPAKLVVPLILFVFPTLLAVLMLPAVVRMMYVFGNQSL